VPQLQRMNLISKVWFQQDGATAHYAVWCFPWQLNSPWLSQSRGTHGVASKKSQSVILW
jgi:hypothetical protein